MLSNYLTLAALVGQAYAVKCGGPSGNEVCNGNADPNSLREALQEIQALPRDIKFSDGPCITEIPSPVNSVFCLYYSDTGASWSVAQTEAFVQLMLNAGCTACANVSTGGIAGQLIAEYFN